MQDYLTNKILRDCHLYDYTVFFAVLQATNYLVCQNIV